MKKIIFILEDGEYADYLGNDLVFNIVSSNFKEAIANTVSDIEKESIQWLEVVIHSKTYENRTYYIMHFVKLCDCIDKSKTIFVPETDLIIKSKLKFENIKHLNIFSYKGGNRDIGHETLEKYLLCRNIHKRLMGH